MHLVVIRELPETPETLVLRLLGRGHTLRRAVGEMGRLPQESTAYQRLAPLMVAFRQHILQDLGEGDDMNVLEQFQSMYSQWEQRVTGAALREGRREGRKVGHRQGRREGRRQEARALVTRLLERRFGALPAPVQARLAAADTATLERWAERILTAQSLDDVID